MMKPLIVYWLLLIHNVLEFWNNPKFSLHYSQFEYITTSNSSFAYSNNKGGLAFINSILCSIVVYDEYLKEDNSKGG